nr:MAG TPA: hypothetical protein [Caudoviricetes sp.]
MYFCICSGGIISPDCKASWYLAYSSGPSLLMMVA